MHLPKPNLFGYILAGIIGLLFIVLAVMNFFGNWMLSVICGFAGLVALISTVNTIVGYIKKSGKEQ